MVNLPLSEGRRKEMMQIIFLVIFYIFLHNRIFENKYKFVFFQFKTIKTGDLNVEETTLLEWKPLFSLKTFYFNKGKVQEIYHTHSFSAFNFLIYGNYIEAFYDKNKGYWKEPRNRSRLIYIPKDRFHQITQSQGCRTIMLTGPWGDTYQEYNPTTDEIIIGIHGRKEISREISE